MKMRYYHLTPLIFNGLFFILHFSAIFATSALKTLHQKFAFLCNRNRLKPIYDNGQQPKAE